MVFDKIKEIVVDMFEVDEDQVVLDADIQEDLGADSLDIVDFVMAIEDQFEVKIPDEAIENIKTVGDLVKYVESNMNS